MLHHRDAASLVSTDGTIATQFTTWLCVNGERVSDVAVELTKRSKRDLVNGVGRVLWNNIRAPGFP